MQILQPKHALRSIVHIIMLLVESTAPAHQLRPVFAAALSATFYQLDEDDMAALRKDCQEKGVTLTHKVTKEARRRGKVRSYVSGQDLRERFEAECRWWRAYGINLDTGEYLFTEATVQLVDRVCTWIDRGEVADPVSGREMWTNIAPPGKPPRWISRRDTCKVEGSNTLDHAVFQPGHTASSKAHQRMLLSVVVRNHKRAIEHRGAPDFGHFNFRLIQRIQALQLDLDILDNESPIGKWRVPSGTPKYKLGIKALPSFVCEQLEEEPTDPGDVLHAVRAELEDPLCYPLAP